ncbi:uncharacterized protein [Magallana gigas]|uniref:uncharacterized protein n=1 Tax=Magallana gigas TaxID=29159 RepID=UPI00333EC62A
MFYQLTSICLLLYLNAEVFCSSSAKQCPSDQYYNPKIHNCTDRYIGCPLGYYGSNCSGSCRYPSYGVECQEECLCPKKVCDHVFGCLDYTFDGHGIIKEFQLIVCLLVGIGVVLVIAVFLLNNVANRRFYARHIRENVHYIGSLMKEHSITTDMYKPPELSESEPTDGGVNMLAIASTHRYETVNLE